MVRKLFSLLMCSILCVGLMPSAALAADFQAASSASTAASSAVRAVVAGDYTSAAILDDGSLWAWGDNQYGKVGDGSTEDRAAAVKVMSGVASASFGSTHSAAVTTGGDLYLWGSNANGQYGNGTTTSRTSPVKVMAGVKAVACGASCTAVLKSDGSVWTSGMNSNGALGDGSTTNRSSFVKIMTGASSIAMSGSRGAAVKTDGSLWTWGWNYKGALGDGTTTNRTSPVKIMSGVASVDLGGFHGAAVKTNGSLWTWGLNDSGQLGNGTTVSSSSPVQVASGIKSVSLGMYFSAAVKITGQLLTWGSCSDGSLGTGASANATAPQTVLSGAASVSAGWGHVLAMKQDGSVWVWGKNGDGQLGTGEKVAAATPVEWALDPVRDISTAEMGALSALTYTGQALEPKPVLTLGSKTLKQGTDYTLSYKNNVNAGTATVVVTGKGLFKGARSATFTVSRAPISSASISLASSVAFTGSAVKPAPTITFNGKKLVEGSDFKLSYSNNMAVGTGKVVITGLGNFQSSATKTFAITESEPIPSATLCYGIDNSRLKAADITSGSDFEIGEFDDGTVAICGYYGSSSKVVVPSVIDGRKVVAVDDSAFAENARITEVYLPDTVTMMAPYAFENCKSLKNLNLGSLSVKLDHHGFSGLLNGCSKLERLTMSDKANFSIEAVDASTGYFNIMRNGGFDSLRYVYIGKAMKGMPISFLYGASLQKVDVASGNQAYAGHNGAVYNAAGKKLLIVPAAYAGAYTVKAGCTAIGNYALDGCVKLTRVTIPESVKSIGVGAFNHMKGTIVTPKGSYASYYARDLGLKVSFSGVAQNPYKVSIVKASVNGIKGKVYTGKALTQSPTVKLNGKTLVSGVDYSVSYKANVNAGQATVTVKGKGDYSGAVTKSFKIDKAANPMKAAAIVKAVKLPKGKKALAKAATVVGAVKFQGKAKGRVTYAKIAKGSSKRLSIDKATGKVTVIKGTKAGVYKLKVDVKAAGGANYKVKTQRLTLTVKVKKR